MKKPVSKAPPMVTEINEGENLSKRTAVEQLTVALQKEGLPVPIAAVQALIEQGFVEERMIQPNAAGTTLFHLSPARPLPFSKLPANILSALDGVNEDEWPLGFKDLRAKGLKASNLSLQSSPEAVGLVFETSLNTDQLLGNDLQELCKKHGTSREQLLRILRNEFTDEDTAWARDHGADFQQDYTNLATEAAPRLNSNHTDMVVNTWYNLEAKINLLRATGGVSSDVKGQIA